MRKTKIRTAAKSRAAIHKTEGPDFVALERLCQDITTELQGLGNGLHKAGLHWQALSADVAVRIIDGIKEDLKDGG